MATKKNSKLKVRKPIRAKNAPAKRKVKNEKRLWNCHACGEKYDQGTNHDCIPVTEDELVRNLDDDLSDAFLKLRELGASFGEQRVYNNARAVMFSRRVCYMFVRMKKKYLELCFFLPRKLAPSSVHSIHPVTKTKFSHTIRVIHPDQIEEPLNDWLKEAYDFSV